MEQKNFYLPVTFLALVAFCIGTSEFVTTGLLPNIAKAFHISIPVASAVTYLYALGVVIGAPGITILTIRLPRKPLLLGLIILFIIGSSITALAPSFGILILGRMVTALSHGAFIGIGSHFCTQLCPPEKRGSVLSLFFTGVTLAFIAGIPFGTLVGQHLGWHFPFYIIIALAIISFIGIFIIVPSTSIESTNLRKEFAVFKTLRVWLALFTTAFGFSGVITSYAYIAPMMIDVTGFSPHHLVYLLLLYGVALLFGNLVGGKAADRSLRATLYTLLFLTALLLLIFTFTVHYKIPAIINLALLGFIGFATISPLQLQVMNKAGDAKTLASSANIAAFNFGITFGVFLGSLTIAADLGYTSPNWVGAILTTIGLLIALTCHFIHRHTHK